MDQNYKPAAELIELMVRAAGKGANLLLNIGPQPNGQLPAEALSRLAEIGEWTRRYGDTFYATEAGDFADQDWGTSTRRGDTLYVHVFDPSRREIYLPTTARVRKAVAYDSRENLKVTPTGHGVVLTLPQRDPSDKTIDYIIELNAPAAAPKR